MLMRKTIPSAFHSLTVRSALIAVGAMRLLVPPQEAPMAKTFRALRGLAEQVVDTRLYYDAEDTRSSP